MTQPFAGLYAPVTFGAAFLKIPFRELVDDYIQWVIGNYTNATAEPCEGTFRDALDSLEPLTAPTSKELLVGIEGGFTVILSNGLSGDEHSRATYWSRRVKCEALSVTCVPDRHDQVTSGAYGVYRSMQVQLLSGRESEFGESRRTVTSGNDGDRWSFFTHGEPLSFEDTEKFACRRVRDRFGPENVLAFCRYFGLPLSSEPSCENALLLTFMAPGTIQRSFSYAEARQDQQIEIVS